MGVPVRARLAACALLLAACGGSNPPAGGDGPPGGDGDVGGPAAHEVAHPFPRQGARFGETVRAVDLDADGDQDLLVGAPGEGLVYLAYREGPDDDPRWEVTGALGPTGPVDLPASAQPDHQFGASLDVVELDGDPEPELVVGAWTRNGGEGGAFLFGVGGALLDPPIDVSPPAGGEFGGSVAFGDLDGDGECDLLVGAPGTELQGEPVGSLWYYAGPLDAGLTPDLELPNPSPAVHGSYGLHLAVDQLAGESLPCVYVAAPGNTSSAGFVSAGQIYRFPGPLEADRWYVAEDPFADGVDLPRFGMHIAAGGGFLLVGAPRKDVGSVPDAGLGFAFDPRLVGVTAHAVLDPQEKDLLGFRVGVGDVVGDADPDFLFLGLRSRMLWIWDSDARTDEPRMLSLLPEAGDHAGMGLDVADVVGNARAEVLVGDPTWDRPGQDVHDDPGRVVVHRLE